MTALPGTMPALQLRAPGRLEPVELPVPQPGPGEVLIQTGATTICTSDLHDIRDNPFGIELPRVLGHEAAGVVAACGPGVSGISVGDRVATHPVMPCDTCPTCRDGLRHLCPQMSHLGLDRDGTFAGAFVLRADRVRRLPDAVPFPVGALLEPLCVCLQAVARLGDVAGHRILVLGDGPFGHIILRLLKRAGANPVLSGRTPYRLRATPGIAIEERPVPGSVDGAVLAVHHADAWAVAVEALRPRGRLVLFSSLPTDAALDLNPVHMRELEVVGACNDEDRLDDALLLLTDPVLDLAGLITHQLPFADWETGFSLARDRHDCCLKVALTFPSDFSA